MRNFKRGSLYTVTDDQLTELSEYSRYFNVEREDSLREIENYSSGKTGFKFY